MAMPIEDARVAVRAPEPASAGLFNDADHLVELGCWHRQVEQSPALVARQLR